MPREYKVNLLLKRKTDEKKKNDTKFCETPSGMMRKDEIAVLLEI